MDTRLSGRGKNRHRPGSLAVPLSLGAQPIVHQSPASFSSHTPEGGMGVHQSVPKKVQKQKSQKASLASDCATEQKRKTAIRKGQIQGF